MKKITTRDARLNPLAKMFGWMVILGVVLVVTGIILMVSLKSDDLLGSWLIGSGIVALLGCGHGLLKVLVVQASAKESELPSTDPQNVSLRK